jgi:hypothetical protein
MDESYRKGEILSFQFKESAGIYRLLSAVCTEETTVALVSHIHSCIPIPPSSAHWLVHTQIYQNANLGLCLAFFDPYVDLILRHPVLYRILLLWRDMAPVGQVIF